MEGWTQDTLDKGLIYIYTLSEEYNWEAWQTWGFMEIHGERRHCRRIKLVTPSVRLDKVLVYDYQNDEQ